MLQNIFDTFGRFPMIGKAATLGAVAAIATTGWCGLRVGMSFFATSLDSIEAPKISPEESEKYVDLLTSNQMFIDDKSPFFTVARPVTPPPPPVDTDEKDPPVEPPAMVYRGPKLIGLASRYAYFDRAVASETDSTGGRVDRKELQVGQVGTQIELVRIIPPFKAVVNWREKEWTLDLEDVASSYVPNAVAAEDDMFGSPSRRGGDNIFGTPSVSTEPVMFESVERSGAASPSGGPAPSRMPPRTGGDD